MKILLVLLLVAFGCTGTRDISYIDDSAFLKPTLGNSPEHPLLLNGKGCLDIDGIPGLCSLRIKSDSDLEITLNGRDYSYQLELSCSAHVATNLQISVPGQQIQKINIPSERFKDSKSFICIGGIYPQDRPDEVSSKFEFRVKVISPDYESREEIQIYLEDNQWFAAPGKYALHTYIYDNNQWKYYYKATSVKVTSPNILVLSESRLCRYNFYQP
jgi:hypothetical protein